MLRSTGLAATVRSGPCCRLLAMRMTGIIGAALLGVLLAGCGSPAAPGVRASSEPSAEAPVSETAAPVVEVFGLPADCASILPASRLAEF